MTPKTIEAAVQKVADKEERSKNVIIYGLKEEKEEKLKNRVEEVLAEIGDKTACHSQGLLSCWI